ncbi:phage tail tape measure protein [Lacisediminihabitans changchengi]|uniref:Phage tail tape measure protein n=1 Tax=Lacisediminihabitans changchengi TaxID=2787634 RepID=A0A934SKV7_9MICO|nr:phage tail tape measure protein [Lacisediminihabitans changchengi]MBK4347244.1 phage tail tape measure protein [Lacisediminihabitans changchengi]
MEKTISAKDFVVNILGDTAGVDKTFATFEKHAGKVAAGVALSFAAVKVGELISGNMDIAQGQAKLKAQLGTSAQDSGELGTVAGQVWAKGFTGSMDEVNDGIAAVTRNVGDVGDIGADAMNKITTKALVTAKVFDQDVGRTTAAVGKILKAGLAPDADAAFDIIDAGLQSNANEADDLLDTFTEYSTEFRQLGLDGQTALGLINQGLTAGARNADIVADALKEFAIRGQGAVIKSTVDQATATARAQAAGESLARAQGDELRAQQSLNDARKDAADRLSDMSDQLVSAQLGERGATLAVQRAQENLTKTIRDKDSTGLDRDEAQLALENAEQALKEQKQSVIDLAAAKADADAKGVDGSEQVVTAQRAVVDSHKATTVAQKENAAAQTDSRVTLTALGLAYKSIGVDGVKAQEAIAAGGPGAKQALEDVLNGLRGVEDPAQRSALAVTFFGTKAEDMQQALYALDPSKAVDGLDDVTGASQRMVDSIADGPKSKVDGMKNAFNNWASSMVSTEGPVGDVAAGLMAFGPGAATVLGAIAPLVTLTAARIAGTAATAANTTATVANSAAWYASPVTWIVLAIVGAIALLILAAVLIVKNWGGISKWFGELWQNIIVGVKAFVGWLWDAFTTFTPLGIIIKNWGAITDFFKGFWDGLVKGATDGVHWIGDRVSAIVGFFTSIPDRVGDAWNGLIGLVRDVMLHVTKFAVEAWNNTLGGMSFDMPWILGGAHIAFPKLKVPMLAEGGIVSSPTLALIGEAGPEAVVPLSRYNGGGGGDASVDAIVEALERAHIRTEVNLDGRRLVKALDTTNSEKR